MNEKGDFMKQFVGTSKNCDLKEAVRGLDSPKLIILCVSEKDLFESKVKELETIYPNIPSIGCVGQSYGGTTVL